MLSPAVADTVTADPDTLLVFAGAVIETVGAVVSGGVKGLNVAVTARLELTNTEHDPLPTQSPLQPANTEPGSAAADKVTFVPELNDAVQSCPQLMAVGLLVT